MQQASVLGKEFSFAALSHMTDLPEEQLVEVLVSAMASGLVIDSTVSVAIERYGFREDHVREALYESIPVARRRRYHLQAGRAVEATQPRRLGELAYHFTNGGDATLGASYSFQAAERSSALYTWARAIPLY
jgi:predicted ATPase